MGALLQVLLSLATSRVGLAAIVGAICWAWGVHSASGDCEARVASLEASRLSAQLAERARQSRAVDAIAQKDRALVAETVTAAAAMQTEIDRLQAELAERAQKEPSHVVKIVDRCAVDGAYARRVRAFDRAGHR